MADLHVYKNNPTAGNADGSQVSEGTGLNPIFSPSPLSVVVGEESSAINLAVRTDTGFKATAGTTITPTGTSKDNWCLSLDGQTWLAYGAMLTFVTEITAVNTLFYAKCKSVTGEAVANDTSVHLQIVGNVVAV